MFDSNSPCFQQQSSLSIQTAVDNKWGAPIEFEPSMLQPAPIFLPYAIPPCSSMTIEVVICGFEHPERCFKEPINAKVRIPNGDDYCEQDMKVCFDFLPLASLPSETTGGVDYNDMKVHVSPEGNSLMLENGTGESRSFVVDLYDTRGLLVKSSPISVGANDYSLIRIEDLTAGVFLCTLKENSGVTLNYKISKLY